MSEVEVYEAIRKIAQEQCKEKETLRRTDLAYELKELGVEGDSIDVARLVLEAYRYYDSDHSIEKAFVTNDGRRALVDEYLMTDLLASDRTENAMALAEEQLSTTSKSLSSLERQVNANMNRAVEAKASSGILDKLIGTGGVKKVRAEASALFGGYAKMVETYHEGEDMVRRSIVDFTTIRTDISAAYQEYAMQLIDVYGESIKMVAPRLFDFDTVQYLDVDSMLKHTELEYNRITDTCGVLIGEISESFQTSVRDSVGAYKSAEQSSKALGLAMAGLTMISHYMDASERTNALRSDLVRFKTGIRHDATQIKADLGRLLVIYKSLNDVAIPKASIYMRYAERLMASDIQAIIAALYDSPELRQLSGQRRSLMAQSRVLDSAINDHLQSIDVYQSLVCDLSQTLEAKRPAYEEAMSKKPRKPFFLFNLLTFGYLGRKYDRNYAEWDYACHPLVEEYESNMLDLKLDKDELAAHRRAAKEKQRDLRLLKQRVGKISEQIRGQVSASEEIQMQMLPHLRKVIAMLRLGRDVVETQLDQRLTGTVDIPDYSEAVQLPADVEENISTFTSLLADNLHADRASTLALLDGLDDCTGRLSVSPEGQGALPGHSEEDIMEVTQVSEEMLQRGISLFDSVMRLKHEQISGRLASEAYDQELDRISEDFRKQIDGIDDKSAFVREVMRRVNLAEDDEDRKQALLLLSDISGQSLSAQDLKDLIDGRKTITL